MLLCDVSHQSAGYCKLPLPKSGDLDYFFIVFLVCRMEHLAKEIKKDNTFINLIDVDTTYTFKHKSMSAPFNYMLRRKKT